METEERRRKKKFVVYNTNDPSLFTSFKMDGYTFDEDHFGIIEATCKYGPYLGFFLDYPFFTYQIRGSFSGFDEGDCDPKTPHFWCVDCTGLPYDSKQKLIVETIIAAIREIPVWEGENR